MTTQQEEKSNFKSFIQAEIHAIKQAAKERGLEVTDKFVHKWIKANAEEFRRRYESMS